MSSSSKGFWKSIVFPSLESSQAPISTDEDEVDGDDTGNFQDWFKQLDSWFVETVVFFVRGVVQRRKWSLTANDLKTGNDPQIGPQMIPDVHRKWYRRKTKNGMEFGFPEFF